MAPPAHGDGHRKMKKQNWSLHPIQRFGDFSDKWKRINDNGPNTVILDPVFLSAIIDEFSSGKEILGIYGDLDDPSAMAVFEKNNLFSWQTYQPAQAPIGFYISKNTNEWENQINSLFKSLEGHALIIGITQQDPDILPRPREAGQFKTMDHIRTSRLNIGNDYSSFWGNLPKKFKQNLESRQRKISRRNISTRLEIITHPDSIKQAVDKFGILESKGWKGKEGSALHPNNRQGRLYREIAYNLSLEGKSRVYQLYYDTKLVATDICGNIASNLVFLKTTYDEDEKNTSPSQIMRNIIIEGIYKTKEFNTIDFYGKTLSWHKNVTNDSRVMYHCNAYRNKIVNFADNNFRRNFMQ